MDGCKRNPIRSELDLQFSVGSVWDPFQTGSRTIPCKHEKVNGPIFGADPFRTSLVRNIVFVSLLEGGVKGVWKPQNRTEKVTKTAIPHQTLPKYRNRSYKCGCCPLINTWGPSFHYKCDLMYSNNRRASPSLRSPAFFRPISPRESLFTG